MSAQKRQYTMENTMYIIWQRYEIAYPKEEKEKNTELNSKKRNIFANVVNKEQNR